MSGERILISSYMRADVLRLKIENKNLAELIAENLKERIFENRF